MRELTSREVKETGLQLLLLFDKFCKEHGLKYFLSYGTLLGAVRHGGFIPWDDDIDVVMPHRDYENFIVLWKQNENDSDRVTLLSDRDFSLNLCFLKLIDKNTLSEQDMFYTKQNAGVGNIWIDIFPMDGTSSDEKLARRHSRHIFLYTYFQILTNVYFKNIFLRAITFPILVGFRMFRKPILSSSERIAQKYDYDKSEYVGNFIYTFSQKSEKFEKSLFDETTEVSFEGHYFPCVKNYDYYLTKLYNNYMIIPPLKKQDTHLGVKFYLLDEKEGLFHC